MVHPLHKPQESISEMLTIARSCGRWTTRPSTAAQQANKASRADRQDLWQNNTHTKNYLRLCFAGNKCVQNFTAAKINSHL
jgi:hypothetical protein